MEDQEAKRGSPAYATFKTFSNTINSLQESGAPSQIDRSVLKSMSGSDQSAVIASLKYLNLITESNAPTPALLQLIDAKEENRAVLWRDVVEKSYPFLFGASIDLKRATTKQIEEAFRGQGVSGSTVVKCIAFFLAAAKAGNISISPHVKTPAPVRSTTTKPRTSNTSATSNGRDDDDEGAPPEGMKQIKIQLMSKPDVTITLPDSFDAADWRFLKPILEAYMLRMVGS